MKIGLIQHNSTPGDFPRNVRSIVDGYRECVEAGAQVVFTPALALPGFGCRDLTRLSRFPLQASEALSYLAKEIMTVPLCVGTLRQNYYGEWEESYAILENGGITEIIPYGTGLDAEPALFEVASLGVLLMPEGVECPLETNVDLIVCPSSNRWYLDRNKEVWEEQSSRATCLSRPVAYCAATGASDHALLNGQSFVVKANGELAGRLGAFQESTLIYDLTEEKASLLADEPEDMEMLYLALTTSIRDYCKKSGITSLCLGLSGGIDSALVAALATEALGAENVMGITMPSIYSSEGSVNDSLALAEALGITCNTISITPVFEKIKESLAPLFGDRPEDVTEENMQSRIRGIFLMSTANKFGHMLLSTGNKSEAAVGYCTIYGDSCGGMAPIADLYKEQVYALSKWINREKEIIPVSTLEKAPSAELRHGQKDQDSLPPYDILDAILKLLIEEELSATDIIQNFDFEESTVRWVQRRVAHNEWKRKQGALVPLVSKRGFAPPRDYPIVQNFRD